MLPHKEYKYNVNFKKKSLITVLYHFNLVLLILILMCMMLKTEIFFVDKKTLGWSLNLMINFCLCIVSNIITMGSLFRDWISLIQNQTLLSEVD